MSRRMKRRFLVTGGAGFIGSHLAAALLAEGHAVRVLDDLSTGHRANLAPEAELIEGCITDAARVREALDGVDGCFHLAAIASVERGVQAWVGTHRVNLTGTITILDALRRRSGAGRVPMVYASSAAVYGDCTDLPIRESAERQPLSAYGADKLGCELHARVATASFGIPTVGLRFFNVFGPRQDPRSPYSGVISIFCDRLRQGLPVEIFGDGRQTRDFIYVADVVTALLRAMARQPEGAPVFNVCTGQATSVLDLAGTIAELCGTRPALRWRPARAGEIVHSLGAREQGAAALGLPAPTSLRDGLRTVLEWLAEATPPVPAVAPV